MLVGSSYIYYSFFVTLIVFLSSLLGSLEVLSISREKELLVLVSFNDLDGTFLQKQKLESINKDV
jgi:hypothetical protein